MRYSEKLEKFLGDYWIEHDEEDLATKEEILIISTVLHKNLSGKIVPILTFQQLEKDFKTNHPEDISPLHTLIKERGWLKQQKGSSGRLCVKWVGTDKINKGLDKLNLSEEDFVLCSYDYKNKKIVIDFPSGYVPQNIVKQVKSKPEPEAKVEPKTETIKPQEVLPVQLKAEKPEVTEKTNASKAKEKKPVQNPGSGRGRKRNTEKENMIRQRVEAEAKKRREGEKGLSLSELAIELKISRSGLLGKAKEWGIKFERPKVYSPRKKKEEKVTG